MNNVSYLEQCQLIKQFPRMESACVFKVGLLSLINQTFRACLVGRGCDFLGDVSKQLSTYVH